MSDVSNTISGQNESEVYRFSVQIIFAMAVMAGSIGIFLGVHFNSSILSVFVPLLIMAIYISWMLKSETDLPKITIGDSFYYLGFIFTLVSLVASLASLSNNDGVNMNAIIGSFGAALTTTIVGLVARLFVTAFAVETKVRRERLEEELERSITSLSEKLKELTTYSTSSLIEVHAQTEEALKSTLLGYQKINDDVARSFETSMEQGVSGVKSALEQLAIRVDSIEVDPRPLESTFNEFISVIDTQRESYSSLNDNIIDSNNKLSLQLSSSNLLISGHISNLESELSDVVSRHSQSYEEALGKIASSIYSSLGEMKDIKMDAKEIAEKELSRIGDEINDFSSMIKQWSESVSDSFGNFSAISESMTSNAELVSNSIKSIGATVEDLNIQTINVKDLNTPVLELIDVTKRLNTQVTDSMEASKSANVSLLASAKTTEEASNQVAKDISKVYSSLANQLESLNAIKIPDNG